jgi:hypothetical protein
MQKLFELCKDYHIKMSVAVIPVPSLLLPQEAGDDCYADFWEKFCLTRQIHFVNHIPDFINEVNSGRPIRDFFIDKDVHFNKKGHMLVARGWLKRYQDGSP